MRTRRRHPCPAPATGMGILRSAHSGLGSGRMMSTPSPNDVGGYWELHAMPVWGMGEISAGDSIPDLIVDALALGGLRLHAGDIVVVKHKMVFKAEGRMVDLETVNPSAAA